MNIENFIQVEKWVSNKNHPHQCWSEKVYEAILNQEEKRDILSLDHSRFVGTCWHLLSCRHSRVYLGLVSYPRTDIPDHLVASS